MEALAGSSTLSIASEQLPSSSSSAGEIVSLSQPARHKISSLLRKEAPAGTHVANQTIWHRAYTNVSIYMSNTKASQEVNMPPITKSIYSFVHFMRAIMQQGTTYVSSRHAPPYPAPPFLTTHTVRLQTDQQLTHYDCRVSKLLEVAIYFLQGIVIRKRHLYVCVSVTCTDSTPGSSTPLYPWPLLALNQSMMRPTKGEMSVIPASAQAAACTSEKSSVRLQAMPSFSKISPARMPSKVEATWSLEGYVVRWDINTDGTYMTYTYMRHTEIHRRRSREMNK